MRSMVGWLLGGLLVLGTGCVLEAEPIGEDDSEVVVAPAEQPFAGDRESFVIDSPRPGNFIWQDDDSGRVAPPTLEPVSDPCSCSSAACFDHWVEHNLGCDVCVVLYCDDAPGQHLCNHCSDSGSGHDHGVNGPTVQ